MDYPLKYIPYNTETPFGYKSNEALILDKNNKRVCIIDDIEENAIGNEIVDKLNALEFIEDNNLTVQCLSNYYWKITNCWGLYVEAETFTGVVLKAKKELEKFAKHGKNWCIA